MIMTEREICISILNQLYEVNNEGDFKAIRRSIKKLMIEGYISQLNGRGLLLAVSKGENDYIDKVRNSLEKTEE